VSNFVAKSTDEWYTPPELLRLLADLYRVGEFYDPCFSAAAPGAHEGLLWGEEGRCAISEPWLHKGGPVFLNPPYSRPDPFIDRYVEQALDRPIEGAVLVNASTETRWFQKLMNTADFMLLFNHRVRFWRPFDAEKDTVVEGYGNLVYPKSPRYANALFFFNPPYDPDDHFDDLGTVLRLRLTNP
jgi:hypothetical protein